MKSRRRKRLAQALPSDRKLAAGLATALKDADGEDGGIIVLDRRLNTYYSSHPSEVVRCRWNGVEHSVLIKYGTRSERMPHAGRGGVDYEARVYQEILHTSTISSARLLGVLELEESGSTWLIIEYLTGCDRLNDLEDAVVKASTWLGEFHAVAEADWSVETYPFLRVYDSDYYRFWADAAARRLAPLQPEHKWIARLTDTFMELLVDLSDASPVVIHGEFYPHNILVRHGEIYPIDWESTAFGYGEIDLVSLIDGWDRKTAETCKRAYSHARWGTYDKTGLERCLLFADMYWNLRWLSGLGKNREPFDPSSMTTLPPRLSRLQSAYKRLHAMHESD